MQPEKKHELEDSSSILERFAALNRASACLLQEMDERKLVDLVARVACDITGAQYAALVLRSLDEDQCCFSPEGNTFSLASTVGITPVQARYFYQFLLDTSCVLSSVLCQGIPLLLPDLRMLQIPAPFSSLVFGNSDTHIQHKCACGSSQEDLDEQSTDPLPPGISEAGMRSLLGIPLVDGNQQVLGALFVGHAQPAKFTSLHEGILMSLATQVVLALENVHQECRAHFSPVLNKTTAHRNAWYALLQMIIDELPNCIYIVRGVDARLVIANHAAQSVWRAVWRVNQPMCEFLDENKLLILDRQGHVCQMDQLATIRAARYGEAVYHREAMHRFVDGTVLPVVLNAVPLDRTNWLNMSIHDSLDIDDAEPVALIVYQDITAVKMFEHRKDELIGFVAHELRAPLTILSGHVQTLLMQTAQGHGTALADWQYEALRELDQSAHDMTHLVADLLDVTRLQAGHLTIDRQPTDMVALAKRVIRRLQSLSDIHALSFHTDVAYAVVDADTRRIEQVVNNVLNNAMKYSPSGGMIDVVLQIEMSANHEQMAVLSIRDDGIGIPAGEQERVFKRFGRADNASFVSGIGLGLYLCRALVTQQSGRIWFESEEGHGTTFYIALPLYSEWDD